MSLLAREITYKSLLRFAAPTILPRFLGVDGVWLASPAAEVLAMGLAFWMFREKGRAYGM